MQNKELRAFVASVLSEKDLHNVEPEIQEKLIDDLTGRLEDQINRALINELSEEQVEEFTKLVEAEDVDAIGTYFYDKKINVTEVVTKVMSQFRASYLTA